MGLCAMKIISLNLDFKTGEEYGEAIGGICRGNGKQSRTGLAEKLTTSRAHGIVGSKI